MMLYVRTARLQVRGKSFFTTLFEIFIVQFSHRKKKGFISQILR